MTLKLAQRATVPPFIVMDILQAAADRAAAGLPVYHLGAGQPALGVPDAVLAGAQQALRDDPQQGYTVTPGLPTVRQRIAAHYQSASGLDIDPRRVMLTTGSSGAFMLAFTASFAVGDRVGIALPGYPAYPNILQSLGIKAVGIPVDHTSRYQLTAEVLEDFCRRTGQSLEGVIVASPSNPTGTVLPAAEMEKLCQWCDANGVRLISDELYHGITYGAAATSALAFSDTAIIINSFSKYFCMTGWRLGWMVLPDDLVRPLECLAQNTFISPPTISQQAGALVFDHLDEFDRRVQTYAVNRQLLLDELPQAGITRFAPPDGAFYLYADFSDYTNDSLSFCRSLLEGCGVAATPGVDFDPLNGHHWVRFSFARDTAHIRAAVAVLRQWLHHQREQPAPAVVA